VAFSSRRCRRLGHGSRPARGPNLSHRGLYRRYLAGGLPAAASFEFSASFFLFASSEAARCLVIGLPPNALALTFLPLQVHAHASRKASQKARRSPQQGKREDRWPGAAAGLDRAVLAYAGRSAACRAELAT
jgi:hypothetical protein